MNTLYIDTPSIDLYPIDLILKVKVIWLHPPENPRRIGEMAFSVKTITFSHFDPETRPRARRLAAKARPPTPNAQRLGLPARLPISPARGLLPSADMLAALERVLEVKAPAARHICSLTNPKRISAPAGRHGRMMPLLNGAWKMGGWRFYKYASPHGLEKKLRQVGRVTPCAPPLANERIQVHHDSAHGVTRAAIMPTSAFSWCGACNK